MQQTTSIAKFLRPPYPVTGVTTPWSVSRERPRRNEDSSYSLPVCSSAAPHSLILPRQPHADRMTHELQPVGACAQTPLHGQARGLSKDHGHVKKVRASAVFQNNDQAPSVRVQLEERVPKQAGFLINENCLLIPFDSPPGRTVLVDWARNIKLLFDSRPDRTVLVDWA